MRCCSIDISEATCAGSSRRREQLDAHVVYKSCTCSPAAHKCYNMRTFPSFFELLVHYNRNLQSASCSPPTVTKPTSTPKMELMRCVAA